MQTAFPRKVGGQSLVADWPDSKDIFTKAVDANQENSALSKLKNTIAIPCAISNSEGPVE